MINILSVGRQHYWFHSFITVVICCFCINIADSNATFSERVPVLNFLLPLALKSWDDHNDPGVITENPKLQVYRNNKSNYSFSCLFQALLFLFLQQGVAIIKTLLSGME